RFGCIYGSQLASPCGRRFPGSSAVVGSAVMAAAKRPLSIRATLALISAGLVLLAMVAGLSLLAATQYRAQRAENLNLTRNLAALIAANLQAAVVFDDLITARELLLTLRTVPEIAYAAAYRRHDDLLAEYPAPPHQLPQRVLLSVAGELAALPSGSVYRYLDSDTPLQQHLLVVAPITQEGETLGYLVLVH